MREQVEVGKEFNILSRKIDNATTCTVSCVFEDCFEVELAINGEYEVDESVELYAMTSKGQLYFETIVKEVNENKVVVWFPISFKYLQRREYSRIQLNKEVLLGNISAQIIDISAGGLKIKTKKQLTLLEKYPLKIDIENNSVVCFFEPIRIEVSGDEFISSGRFKELSNYDRIALVQFCFGKQIENSNK